MCKGGRRFFRLCRETRLQQAKRGGRIPIVIYGPSYWDEIVDFDALLRHGMISPEDLELFRYADDPATALRQLQAGLASEAENATPAFAHSCAPVPEDD